MSNRIDFFGSAGSGLSVPAGTVSVFYDGSLCRRLEPVEVVRGGVPEFSWARLALNTAACQDKDSVAVEEIESEISIGKAISIRQVHNEYDGGRVFGLSIFEGQVEGIETKLGENGESAEIIAADCSAVLSRVTVYGRRMVGSDGSSVFLAGPDTVFNPAGKGNASAEPTQDKGRFYTAFSADSLEGKYWSYAEAIYYLLCEYLPAGVVGPVRIEQLTGLTDGQIVRDLDVTSLDLIEALRLCCEAVGLEFEFVPRCVATGVRQAIVFYRPGRGKAVELNCQRGGERLCLSKTNIARLYGVKNFWPVTHKYIGQGDSKVYEATFELVKAWDASIEDTDYDKFSASSNAEFYKVKDVYRKWCLNEAGYYSGAPFGQGEAFDFSQIFEGAAFVRCPRRFWPALTTDSQGKSLGYFLEVSYDNGAHWWQYLYAFNNLLDECGVWLSSDRLDVETWVAALKGVLKFRITASVVSDERLSCGLADGPVNSVAPVVEHIVREPERFKFRKVSGVSIFAGAKDAGLGTADEVDDTNALYEFVRKRASRNQSVIETVDVQTPYLAFGFQVGDRVTCSPESRDLLGCRRDSRSISRIKRVRMDFRKQCTELKVVRHR